MLPDEPPPPIDSDAAGRPAEHTGSLVMRVGRELARLIEKPIAAGLHLVATPIGNLGDITLRALTTLDGCDAIYCEDTRRSRILIQHFGIERPLRLYHEHNAAAARPEILRALGAGKRLALISDAGTPLVSDPGFKLVRAAIEAGHAVTALPGPSAALAALSVAGLPTDCFLFTGFLPARSQARRTRLAELTTVDTTLVVFETGPRLAETLGDMAAVLGPRPAAITRELTKLHEEVVRGDLAGLSLSPQSTLGEFVIVIGPPLVIEVTDQMIVERLDAMPADVSVRDRARDVAAMLGVPKARVYALAVKTRT